MTSILTLQFLTGSAPYGSDLRLGFLHQVSTSAFGTYFSFPLLKPHKYFPYLTTKINL